LFLYSSRSTIAIAKWASKASFSFIKDLNPMFTCEHHIGGWNYSVHPHSQLSSQSSPKFPKFPKALGGGEVGVQEMNEQTSDTLEVGNSIIHNVIETRDVGLQSIRLPMTLHIQPKYCIPGLCQPDTRPCRIKNPPSPQYQLGQKWTGIPCYENTRV
jgi:hypothetical protein